MKKVKLISVFLFFAGVSIAQNPISIDSVYYADTSGYARKALTLVDSSAFVKYTGNDKDLDMGAYKVTAKTAKITGLAGVGTRLGTIASDGTVGAATINDLGIAPAVSGGYLPLSGGVMSTKYLVTNLSANYLGSYMFNSLDLNNITVNLAFRYDQILASSTNSFFMTNNANAVITINTYPDGTGLYYHQLGFNGEGTIYTRVNGGSWKEIYTGFNSNLPTVNWTANTLTSDALAGTGTRLVAATSDGTLTPSIAEQSGDTLTVMGKVLATNISGTNTGDQDLTGYRQKSDHDSLSALDEKSYNSLTDKPNLSVYLTSEVDGSTTNEIQDLSRSNDTIYLSYDASPVVLNDFQHDSDTLTWDATLSDLNDSISALRAIIPTVETTATIKAKLGIATNSTEGYLLATDWTAFNAKQTALVSGTNIKTINSASILGSGNIAIAPMVYPSAGIAVSTGSAWGGSITDNSANWNRAYTMSDSLKNDVLDTSSVNINKPNWTKFIQSVTAVQGIPKVGDYYGGGIVYYVSPSGTYGYCVCPSVIKTGIQWSPSNNNAQIASNRAVGAGISNTTAIVAVFGVGNYAAYVCDTLNYGGYSDWALPSIGDVDLIHDSLYSTFPEENPERYYCSNDTIVSAYTYYWGIGDLITAAKGTATYLNEKGVLAVRRFVVSTQNFNLNVSESDGSPSYSGINAMQFANCTLTQPTSNTVLITPTSGGSMTGDQIVAALNANDSTTLTKAIYSPELGMKNTTNEAYNYYWSAYYDDVYTFGIYLSQSPKGGYSRELRYEANNNILYVPKLNLESGSYVSSIGTGAATGSSTTKLVTEDMLVKTVQASGGGDMLRSTYDTGYNGIVDNSEKLGGQLPSYYMPNVAASSVGLGGVQISTTDGGLAMSGNYLLQKDNVLTTRTPEASDYIAFYDNSATAQGKMTLSTLGSLIGGSGAVTSVTGTSPIVSSGGTTPAISISAATTSAAGSMSATDKTKLDGFRSITPQSITTSASCATYCNFYTSASGSKTITFSNLIEGLSGQVEVSYSSASVITFAASGYTVMVASNIYNGTTGQVTSKSTGTAIYSYYVRNSKIYINGTQTYN